MQAPIPNIATSCRRKPRKPAAFNLDPEIPGFVIKLIRLVVFMVSHCSSLSIVTTRKGNPDAPGPFTVPVAPVLIPFKAFVRFRLTQLRVPAKGSLQLEYTRSRVVEPLHPVPGVARARKSMEYTSGREMARAVPSAYARPACFSNVRAHQTCTPQRADGTPHGGPYGACGMALAHAEKRTGK